MVKMQLTYIQNVDLVSKNTKISAAKLHVLYKLTFRVSLQFGSWMFVFQLHLHCSTIQLLRTNQFLEFPEYYFSKPNF